MVTLVENVTLIKDNSKIKLNPINYEARTNETATDDKNDAVETTKILIVFLIIVFVVLTTFLLLYYYCIRGMKSKPLSRMTNKSVSGSINDEKNRNIFANPQRHLAVDQSLRQSPSTSSEHSSPISSNPPIIASQQRTSEQAPQQASQQAPQQVQQQASDNSASTVASKTTSEPAVVEPSKTKRSNSSSKGRGRTNVAGTLAGLRDVLKESSK